MAKKLQSGGLNRQVFLNIPFDDEYHPLFEAMVFAVIDCGFVPRCALESSDGGEIRLDKLVRLIRECKHSIHDISRTELDAANQLPRFNMPFELGLFMGALRFGRSAKRCLIFDREKYRFQKFLSDISGQDPRSHHNEGKRIIEAVRDWLVLGVSAEERAPGSKEIFRRFLAFKKAYPELCRRLKLDHGRFHFNDFCLLISAWMKESAEDVMGSPRKPLYSAVKPRQISSQQEAKGPRQEAKLQAGTLKITDSQARILSYLANSGDEEVLLEDIYAISQLSRIRTELIIDDLEERHFLIRYQGTHDLEYIGLTKRGKQHLVQEDLI